MTTNAILVIGATGSVGSATIRELQARGAQPIAFVRDRAAASALLGERTPVRVGDLDDTTSLRAALHGIDAVLLCSAHGPDMRRQQLAAIAVIAGAGASRIVKISGSPVTVGPDSTAHTGRDHEAVEQAMRQTACETVAIRPNVFMANFLDQAQAIGHGALPGPANTPPPRVSFVDVTDIAAVAAAELLGGTPPPPILELTGPQALTWFDVATLMTDILGRPITHYPAPPEVIRNGLLAAGRPEWLVDHMLEIGALLAQPKAAEITSTIHDVTGRDPTTLEQWLTANAARFPAAS